MSSPAPRRSPPPSHPLIAARQASDVVATRRGEPVTAAQFIHDVRRVAQALPERRHVLNFCSDRYRFAVVFCAAVIRGQTTLLPPTTTPNVIAAMRAFAPDVFYVTDDEANEVDLPRASLPGETAYTGSSLDVPGIPGDRVVACVFTSGSTGEPKPHFKSWGAMIENIASEARRFGVGRGHTVLGTVPPQHMFGFESTVLLPLLSGATLTAERLYYPADIEAAAFHALALLGTLRYGDRTFSIQTKAAAIARAVLQKSPNHPGGLHYLIHACDDPQHAHLALDAARKYERIADPNSHALHMPSHIYVQLGLWPAIGTRISAESRIDRA